MIQKETRFYSEAFLKVERDEAEMGCPVFRWARAFPGLLLADLERWSAKPNHSFEEWQELDAFGLNGEEWTMICTAYALATRVSIHCALEAWTHLAKATQVADYAETKPDKLVLRIHLHRPGRGENTLATLTALVHLDVAHQNCQNFSVKTALSMT